MMPVEADRVEFCANCVMHSWNQPEDIGSLINCPGCQLIEYCGEACRKEHWRKVHKNHCQYLADPTKCPQSEHIAETCDICRPVTGTGAICRPAAGTGKGKRRMTGKDQKKNQGSYSYECITKDMHFPPGLSSPHPFPVAGVGDDLLEKSIIVMQKLVHKLQQNPRVDMECSVELEEMEQFLWSKRREIWRYRKVFQILYITLDFLHQFEDLAKILAFKLGRGKAGKDASELWNIIFFIHAIVVMVGTYRKLESLKNPIDSMPTKFRDLVKLALDNKVELLNIAEEIIDSLWAQVIPFEDIVKKLCGGKKRQKCSFCGVKIEVTESIYTENPMKKCSSVLFDAISIRMFTCGSRDCHTKATSRLDDLDKFSLAVFTAYNERKGVRCDFCFQLCPIDQAHRCGSCLTVVYCSKSCNKEDKEKHSRKYCIEDERKTKEDRSMRRQMGEIVLERMAGMPVSTVIKNQEANLNETLEAFHFQDRKSKKVDATNIPTAATVPATENDRSKSGTGAAPSTFKKIASQRTLYFRQPPSKMF